MVSGATEVSFSLPNGSLVHRLGAATVLVPFDPQLPGTAVCVQEPLPGLSGMGLYRETKGPERACQESNNQPFRSC